MSDNSSADTNPAWSRAFIGLGSNLGNRESSIEKALDLFDGHVAIKLLRVTKPVETEPWGPVQQPDFLNAIAEVKTRLLPHPLLHCLKAWERQLGRNSEVARWGPRVIDLDILLYENVIIETPELTIPHPHLTDRPFVLQHLAELDPGLVHPQKKVLLTDFIRQ